MRGCLGDLGRSGPDEDPPPCSFILKTQQPDLCLRQEMERKDSNQRTRKFQTLQGTKDSQQPWAALEFRTQAPAYAGGPRGRAHHTGQLPGVPPRKSQTPPPAPWRLLGYSPQLHAVLSRKEVTSLTLS